jgi:hypothetical protein
MSWLSKFVYGKAKTPKKRKRRLLIFIAALVMFSGVVLQILFKLNVEVFLLGGFGAYTLSELFES